MGTWLKELKHAFAVGSEADVGTPLARPLERFAEEVVKRGMETPAILLLETAQPLGFLSSQVVFAVSPLMSTVVDGDTLEQLAKALEDRRTVGRLIERIECLAREDGDVR